MSFWSKIKEAHRSTIDDVAIRVLQENYTALVNLGLALPPERAAETTAKFVALAKEIAQHFSNWSEQGFLQMAKRIGSDARADQHLDRSSAIAKGLLAVWVESHARSHPIAAMIKVDLDRLITANESTSDHFQSRVDDCGSQPSEEPADEPLPSSAPIKPPSPVTSAPIKPPTAVASPPRVLTVISDERIRALRAARLDQAHDGASGEGRALPYPSNPFAPQPRVCPSCRRSSPLIKLRSSEMCCPTCGQKWPAHE